MGIDTAARGTAIETLRAERIDGNTLRDGGLGGDVGQVGAMNGEAARMVISDADTPTVASKAEIDK